ncbi:MAG: lysyl-tRNA synthetase [Candidatus Magnetoglobus multicellularis str. Araruama]|uniref:Lysyl-tRNA synthetase n=1 Tax=Candidatus Magnetoglobus multicellularis str. Araruama TaxID=890399 RepID=A0A1V1PFZ3_9BACT|nr:MAG: lysyl-tRNA synthetase [Candidatus Magnetoglobus multicellularis str. Araruama]
MNPNHSYLNWLSSRHDRLHIRSQILYVIRNFFLSNNYIEVTTPCRIPEPTPEAFIDSISSEKWYLQTSPELCMKKLIASGLTHIFQICQCFRANERSDSHLSEFTLLEWYRTDASYMDIMHECEQLINQIARVLEKGDMIIYQGKKISLASPWQRISVSEAFDTFGSLSMSQAIEKDQFDEVMVYEIEPALGMQPVILYDYPKERAALARLKADQPDLAERFELYIGGHELANAFSELCDPNEQSNRFETELAERKACGKKTYPTPHSFLKALRLLPETAGIALGIDRLVMLFTDTATIDDVVPFTSDDLMR